jgi:hypothetical protein
MCKEFSFLLPYCRGNQLLAEDQRMALAMFVHRFTKDHHPEWAHTPMTTGLPYPVQFASDSDWLENTFFQTTKAGRLRCDFECYSTPTWPNDPQLRMPRLADKAP